MTVEKLIDTVKQTLKIHTDAELCKVLGITPPVLSKMRAGAVGVGPAYLVRMHEATGMTTTEMKKLIAAQPLAKG